LAEIDAKHAEATKTNMGKYRIALTTLRERAREAGRLDGVRDAAGKTRSRRIRQTV